MAAFDSHEEQSVNINSCDAKYDQTMAGKLKRFGNASREYGEHCHR